MTPSTALSSISKDPLSHSLTHSLTHQSYPYFSVRAGRVVVLESWCCVVFVVSSSVYHESFLSSLPLNARPFLNTMPGQVERSMLQHNVPIERVRPSPFKRAERTIEWEQPYMTSCKWKPYSYSIDIVITTNRPNGSYIEYLISIS